MSDPIRDAAIEAAAKIKYDAERAAYIDHWCDPAGQYLFEWGDSKKPLRDAYRRTVTPLVDAVLAVAGPAYRAEALRDAADDWPEWAKLTDENDRQSLHGHRQVFQSWLRDRAEAEGANHV